MLQKGLPLINKWLHWIFFSPVVTGVILKVALGEEGEEEEDEA